MNVSVNKSLSNLTTIPEKTFSKLSEKIEWCISDGIEKAMLNNEDSVDIDFDIGKIIINFSNNEIRYRFVPSQRLEKTVTNTVLKERNDLVVNVENSLISKLTNTYKTFF